MEDDLIFLKTEVNLKKMMQPKTIKSKNNSCGTGPGNLVKFILLKILERSLELDWPNLSPETVR
jgi:hypothetical protein